MTNSKEPENRDTARNESWMKWWASRRVRERLEETGRQVCTIHSMGPNGVRQYESGE